MYSKMGRVWQPNPENCKNWSYKCAYECAQLQYINGIMVAKYQTDIKVSMKLPCNATSKVKRHTALWHQQDILAFQDHMTRCLEWLCGRRDHDMTVHQDVSCDGTSDSSAPDKNFPYLHSQWSSRYTWQCCWLTDSSATT